MCPPGECRGVGGLFFDDLDTPSQDKLFDFASVSMALVIRIFVSAVAQG